MSRNRELVPEGVYHITCRGNNRRAIFNDDEDYRRFLNVVAETRIKHGFELFHYVLMPNHFHLNPKVADFQKLPKIMQSICHRYSLFHKRKYGRTGTLWEGPYYSNLIKDDEHQLMCGPYIELNPVRAKLVEEPEKWIWSSYRTYSGLETDQPVDIDPFYFPGSNQRYEREEYIKTVAAWSKIKSSLA